MQAANARDVVVFDDDFVEYQRALRAEQLASDELFFYETQFPGTPLGVRAALLRKVPCLTNAAFNMRKPFVADVELELPAWAWLTLGLLHLLTWRRARRVLRNAAPAFVATRITMGVRRNTRPAALAGAAARSTTRIV